ncbi:response regulator [Clostridiaceae bacterium HSG29]|nr:response regulator [Clostridiaceae bacterium HSG29]
MKDSKRKILFVDYDNTTLQSLRRLFFNIEYNCFFARNVKDAFKILKEYDIELIITEITMPAMDGCEFLKKIKGKYPKVIRVALSGYSNKEKLSNLLDQSLIKSYLFKPWDNIELINSIKRTFQLQDILTNEKLVNYIDNMESLPTVPAVYQKINEMLIKNESVEKITREVEKDQALASKILKVANSAFYEAQTGSIKQAIMIIGLNNVKNIVISNALFHMKDVDKAEILWEHAIITNKITGYIYKKIMLKKIPSEYSSAGLLHDVGRVIIINYLNIENKKIDILLNNNPVDLEIRMGYEKKLIGFDHAKIGGYLLKRWEIPLPLVEVALFHHDPLNEIATNKEIVGITYLANIIAWKILKPDIKNDVIDEKVFESLEIPKDKFYKKIDEFIENESVNYN